MNALQAPLSLRLPAALVKKLAGSGLHTVEDLLTHAPRRFYHWGKLTAMNSLQYGQDVTLVARVASTALIANRQRGGVRFEVTLTDGLSTMSATFFGKTQYSLIPHQRLLTKGSTHLFAGKVGQYRGKLQLTHPQFEETPEGDEEAAKARQERPIPIYPLHNGLTPWVMQRAVGMVLDGLDDADVPDIVPEAIRREYDLLSYAQALRMLHQPDTDEDYQAAQRSLRFQEAYTLQVVLRGRRVGQARHRSFPATPGGADSLPARIREHLPFALTSSQELALAQISEDLSQDSPMMRLLQGDVGSGKTIIALLAAAQVIDAGYQVAMLVPTEVLAEQHGESLRQAIPSCVDLPVEVLTSSTSAALRAGIVQRLESAEPLLLVGTHALFEDSVPMVNMGLIVVDEQHRFGVAQRDSLRERGTTPEGQVPHQLVMTATPIPRTVAMTVFGDLEETRMTGMPPGRTPVATYVVDAGNAQWMERLWQRAAEEISNGGRVYVVCPRIDAEDALGASSPAEDEATEDVALLPLFTPDGEDASHALSAETTTMEGERRGRAPGGGPGQPRRPLASVAAVSTYLGTHPMLGAHGIATLTSRDSAADKAQKMAAFSSGEAPILVSTTVIEVGVNVPEATMMIILDAQQFGLSQLHQLRGRVGRSTTPSVCMAVHPSNLPPASIERLSAFASTTDGFELAQVDVKLRKEGDVLGAGQSGRATSLRFLSVVRDAHIISQARSAATDTVTQDPTLHAHPELAAHIRRLEGGKAQWMEKT